MASLASVVELARPAETNANFRAGDSWCRASAVDLRSGIRLGVTECQFEPSFSFPAVQPASEIELVVSKGGVLRTRGANGLDQPRAGHALQLGRTRRPTRIQVQPEDGARTECVSLSMSEHRLRDLLGVSQLPAPFREVTESKESAPLISRDMTAGLYRLLEEIVNADAKGASRVLWHEAKGLELLALMTDELMESDRGQGPRLSAHDIDRLQRARLRLVESLEAPPTLAELARTAGFSETRLKTAFKALFGTSIFAYLRTARMEEARRLLLERHLNVSEAAIRVGYSNPSKFAAAFRRQFDISPSDL
jgi:AraC-like DNA-binding protein